MKKLFVFILLVMIAIILAGLYGMIHNQISYTVSPEYFTKFKFRQFGLADMALPERIRASMVGFLASWWMGIPIGILVGLVGFIHQGARRMFKITMRSFFLVLAFTFIFGLCGLLYGWLQTSAINLTAYQNVWYIPDDVTNLRRFLCAGYMHNSSYLGGTLAIFIGWVYHITVYIKAKTWQHQESRS